MLVNLMMLQTDFAKFVLDLDHYLAEEEAAQKWAERSARIDRDNLFIFLEERDGLTREDILRLGSIHARGLVVFTANAYPDIPYALQIPKYAADGEVGNILEKSCWDDSREYEKYFDFVKWFNEANNNGYPAENYRK